MPGHQEDTTSDVREPSQEGWGELGGESTRQQRDNDEEDETVGNVVFTPESQDSDAKERSLPFERMEEGDGNGSSWDGKKYQHQNQGEAGSALFGSEDQTQHREYQDGKDNEQGQGASEISPLEQRQNELAAHDALVQLIKNTERKRAEARAEIAARFGSYSPDDKRDTDKQDRQDADESWKTERDDRTPTELPTTDMSAPYSGGTDLGSGMTGGPGFGNKTTSDADVDTSTARFGTAADTSHYTGGTAYGSRTTAGPGAGNKNPPSGESKDSTIGKIMEKAGSLLKKDELGEKGQEKREEKGAEF